MKIKSLIILPFFAAGIATAEDLPKPFVQYDANKDGGVQYLEFAKAKKGEFDALDRDRSKSLTLAEASEAPAVESDDFFALPGFDEIDTDKNEVLTLSEYGSVVQKVFKALDASESGEADQVVTLADFAAAKKNAEAEAAKLGANAAAEAAKKGSKKGSVPKKKE